MTDANFVQPFFKATVHVLEVQASVKAQPGKIFIKKPDDQIRGDVSTVIGIVSESFNGTIGLVFPEQTFLKVMSSMLGEEYGEINQEIVDGAGEIMNMVFGQAKIGLNEQGHGIKMAIPSVFSGKDHSFSSNGKGPTFVVPFSSNVGDFSMVICLSEA